MQKILKFVQVLVVLVVAGTAANADVVKMTPDIVREKALAGEVVLIDIRRPDEWAQTGVPDAALLLDMTSRDFVQKIYELRVQSPEVSLAFICRTGNRSNYVATELAKIGLSGLVDVVGGMAGSRVDKGWAKRGLPIRPANSTVHPEIRFAQP